MQLELSKKEFRRLLDMVYIGNWILNSTRGEDRFQDYDHVESLLFDKARQEGMGILAETYRGTCSVLQVGTGDSPATVPFYEKCGFVRHHRVKNFFPDHYDHPIYDGGVLLTDMVYLERKL